MGLGRFHPLAKPSGFQTGPPAADPTRRGGGIPQTRCVSPERDSEHQDGRVVDRLHQIGACHRRGGDVAPRLRCTMFGTPLRPVGATRGSSSREHSTRSAGEAAGLISGMTPYSPGAMVLGKPDLTGGAVARIGSPTIPTEPLGGGADG
jgi:hypothetical protein